MCLRAGRGLDEVVMGDIRGREETNRRSGRSNVGGRKDDGDDGKPLSAFPSSIE